MIAELGMTWVTAGRETPLPGYVCVVSKRHVIEPFELPPGELAAFWSEAMIAARAICQLVQPAKLNYEIHGNTVPHLHLHLFPRFAGDPYVGGPIDTRRASFTRTAAHLEEIGRQIDAMNTHEAMESTSLDRESASYVAELIDSLEELLGDELVGVYIHGSAVLGDFTRTRSDIDLLAVTERGVPDDQVKAIALRLASTSLPRPAGGLEFDLIDGRTLKTASAQPPFELHLSTRPGRSDKVIDGHHDEGNPDLVLHFAVLREHGRALKGPDPKQLFPPIPKQWLLKAFRDELSWAEHHASTAYQVLNACRAWRFLEDGVLCSKTQGGEWARELVPDPSVIDQALEHRRGLTEDYPESERAATFLHEVEERLQRAVPS